MWDDILLYVIIGFVAQMIDGAIGMAYGVTASSVLLSLGIPPATASACVHAAETFTTGASGLAHWRIGNVDRNLIWRLAVARHDRRRHRCLRADPSSRATTIEALHQRLPAAPRRIHHLEGATPLAHVRSRSRPATSHRSASSAALLDALGGGGWGPSSPRRCSAKDTTPRYAIGSVNLAEFFVTLTISTTFLVTVGLSLWPIILGLIIGGVIAAPFAALATKHIARQGADADRRLRRRPFEPAHDPQGVRLRFMIQGSA